jgi:hypothetical protein
MEWAASNNPRSCMAASLCARVAAGLVTARHYGLKSVSIQDVCMPGVRGDFDYGFTTAIPRPSGIGGS